MTKLMKFKNIFTIIILSCFGIGFLPYVSGIVASVLASAIIFYPNRINEKIIYILILFCFLIYLPLNLYFSKNMKGEQRINILSKVPGTWLVLCSSVIIYSTTWIIISLLMFLVLSSFPSKFDIFLLHKAKIWNKLTKDLLAGVASYIVLHVIYAGYLIYPYVLAYLGK